MTTWITVCDTCKCEGWQDSGATRPDGEDLARSIERLPRRPTVAMRRTSCLMGCDHSCNVAIQARGKLSYTLGRFAPGADSARAILAFATLHAASETGQVPFRQWPAGVKGHFVTRHPPLPE